ncbi:MAG: hypothetical protein UV59_C0053G0008 [Candidatus Gottesmanbacteria bacterium GW2011_GWA1_43_11]|uniref:DUF86 domain-containing protein n=1 Tax=Candidatus Gottesmanbacteria bacterium GW2011_GWA1_43_11 TaxID=1618436 RepID=A0A0G1EIF6_9BACT|nr:MAG: hypothetical protein UV59_C0053G0008 [Candidatus Gottesmanbacteria bacterium GW2011_GWA1_43_11]
MPLNKIIVQDLLDQLKNYVYDLESMNFTLVELEQNRDIQHLINHRLHTAVEISIDIAMHIASALELPGRESAVDVILLLGQENIIPMKLAKSFQKAPKLRNLLVHGYAKVDYSMLFRDLPQDIKEIKLFANAIQKYLEII